METKEFLLIIDKVIDQNISDLHLTSNEPPHIRDIIGDIIPLDGQGILTHQDIEDITKIILSREMTEHTIDASFEYRDMRFRINISKILRGKTISFRSIPTLIPTAEEILLPDYLLKLTHAEKGIILITGPTWSGKSTTMATMLDYINKNMKRHIITLEDPVEFVYKNRESLIHQRELGKQFPSFEEGIRSILREDPDVIVVGEMRDLKTIEAAITLAETGHLVFSTLHTNDTVQTVDRIIQSFPPTSQNQIRMQFALAMKAIISQILLPKADGKGRVVAREIMINNDSVRNLIIRWETQHMYGVLETGKQDGMILMDDALINLYKWWYITKNAVLQNVRDHMRLQMLVWNNAGNNN
jgi:twitching motility protein PilT